MIRMSSTTILLLLAAALAPATSGGAATVPEPVTPDGGAATADTVHVAPPTGETDSDRANVQAAFDAVQPGGTVLFAAGTYLLGAGARLTVPDVTVLGHPSGTVLRGCDPEAFAVDTSESLPLVFGCTGLYVQAERQTIRGLTFEYTWHGIVVGPFPASEEEAVALGERGESPPDYPAGGQRIEGNTFRGTPNGLRVLGVGNELSLVRDNDFIDVFHAIGISGAPLHFLDNRVTVAVPGGVPFSKHTGSAIIVSPGQTDCAGHVVAGNRIDGYPDPIYVRVRRGETCRGVEIRDNTIHAARVGLPEAWPGYTRTDVDSTMVGTPITLMNRGEPTPGVPEVDTEGVLEEILVQGNQIVGAEGLGILIQGASRSRIAGNTIVEIQRRDPFPGITWDGFEPRWEAAIGSAIWVSPGSDHNEIAGNTFEEVASAAVFLEGDDNRVELRSADDSVRDLGNGNEVTASDGAGERSRSGPEPAGGAPEDGPGPTGLDPWPSDVPPGDTVRYTGIVNGMTGGERRMWREGPDTWAYSCDMARSCFPRTERLELDDDGLPVRLEVSGQKAPWNPWEERFERQGPVARWTTSVDEGEQPVEGPRFYAALHPAHDPGVLARALLRQPSRRLLLLPEGEARLEALGERTVEREGRTRTVHHYAVHGLDLKPAYVWLDEDGATFTDEWMVREGWESVFPQLKAASRAALADHVRDLARRLLPPPRDRPLAIRGARLFDPTTGSVRAGTTILVEGSRIAAVGADGSLPVPDEADVIDAAGRTVLPGLWDMHTHHGTGYISFFRYRELDAPLHLAGGVTTARDLGSHIDELLSLRRRIDSGEAVGPRLLAAGYIDGVGGSRTGVQVGSPEEARAAVDRFAELGYVQIKIYGELPADLVPVVIERARGHDLRVSGHVPRSLSAREAVEAGFDELQHVGIFVSGILGSLDELIVRWEDDWEGWADAQITLQPGSPAVREFVELLAAEDVALDPTLALALASERPPHYVASVLDRFPPQTRRRLLDRFSLPSPLAMERRDAYVSSWMGFVRAAHEAGVPILPGTDLMPGFGLHRELELYVEAGIPAPEVLRLATIGAARVMGMDDELGSIEPGKLADLILVDGDPTTDIRDIRRVVTVIKDGRVYDPAAIYRALGIEPCCQE